MKVVIDTNVVISGIFFGGNPKKVLQLCIENAITAYVTNEIVSEYERVIEEMQKKAKHEIPRKALDDLLVLTELTTANIKIDICRDPDDNKFIECAISANALYIVSGDKDLSDLKQYNEIKVVTATEFLKIYETNCKHVS